jgi:hypothetical protein
MVNQAEKSQKMEIELISYNNLLAYSQGSTQSAVENFVVDLEGDNFEKIEKEEGGSEAAGIKKGSSGMFSFLKKNKAKKGVNIGADSQPKPTPSPSTGTDSAQASTTAPPKRKVAFGSGPVTVDKNKAKEEGGSGINPGTILKLVLLVVLIGGLGGGYFFLPDITGKYNQTSWEIIKGFFGAGADRISNTKEAIVGEKTEIIDPTQEVEVSPDEPQIDVEKANIEKSIEEAISKQLVGQINPKISEIGNGEEEGTFDKAVDALTGKEVELTKKGLYSYIKENSEIIKPQTIYFINIYDDEGNELALQTFLEIFELDLYPGWQNQVVDYEIMLYTEKSSVEAKSKIRLGMLLIFGQNQKPQFSSLIDWEKTIIQDLQSLYMEGNASLLTDKEFQNSTISPTRRFINLTQDQSLSLDYALAEDGMIIVTSRNFGTSLLNILVEGEDNSSVQPETEQEPQT